jgi:hypothetical protein
MGRALSVDLRDRVVAAIAGGLSRREATVRFGVSAAHATEQDRPDILKRREDWFEGQLDPHPDRLVFIGGNRT